MLVVPQTQPIDYGHLPALAGFNMRRAYFIATQIFANHFSDHKITPIQFALLEIVARNECVTQKEIAEHIGTAPSVIVKPIRDLEEREIVLRKRDPLDRRNHHIYLSPAGRDLQAIFQQQITQVENELLHSLTEDEQNTLITLLNKVVTSHT